MSYKFGQFRRGQNLGTDYLMDRNYSLTIEDKKSKVSGDIIFRDNVLTTSAIQHIDETGLKSRNYYLRFRVYKMWGNAEDSNQLSQKITVRLNNNEIVPANSNAIEDETKIQKLQTFEVPAGIEDDYVIFDLVIAPNANYKRIDFVLERSVYDYTNSSGVTGISGRISRIEILKFAEIFNVIDYLNDGGLIDNKGELKQIGVQSLPGLQMCIDGESIRVGRSGIFEIKNGITIKFIGFVVEDNDNQYFLLDYQY